MKSEKGLVISYFGNGKGKTTAALGLALRSSGVRKKVKIIQFIKGEWKSSEGIAIKKLKGVSIEKAGIGFVGCPGDKHSRAAHIAAAKNGFEAAKQAVLDPGCDVVILDEINWAVSKQLISKKNVLKLIKSLPKEKTLVLTGAPEIKEFIEFSDLVTEMKKIKHPYDKGIMAKEGIDY